MLLFRTAKRVEMCVFINSRVANKETRRVRARTVAQATQAVLRAGSAPRRTATSAGARSFALCSRSTACFLRGCRGCILSTVVSPSRAPRWAATSARTGPLAWCS